MTNDGGIRASDSDRENVVEILRDGYSTGRLTMAEFDERTTLAFAAKTWGELRQLTTDLPQQAKLELSQPEPDRSAAASKPRPLPAGPAAPAQPDAADPDDLAHRRAHHPGPVRVRPGAHRAAGPGPADQRRQPAALGVSRVQGDASRLSPGGR